MKHRSIMVQGTMSNAGKSLLTAALCRIFHQDGFRTAPFKSQNMALNSYITKEGLEMGRAQVVQAEAAGIEPSVYMNPILLKPTNDMGSQVIVNGEVLGDMCAKDYFAYKEKLIPDILHAYGKLAAENDIMVIEGAGSPAEINLKQNDIVNMGMAKMAKSPVLLAGDIDRGGVFAQLVGTVMLLEESERAMIKGLVINKFRGDKTILDPGIRMLEEKCGIPVVGVIPYMKVDIDDEDSLSERLVHSKEEKNTYHTVKIAVIRIPRISNFTDFNVFSNLPGVFLYYVDSMDTLGDPDMIILPGTKNTMGDLLWMRQNGLEAAILKMQAKGTVVFGICGGYQMMGEKISDPENSEGGGQIRGMGLLPIRTIFKQAKVRTRMQGTLQEISGILSPLTGKYVEGYEIHMGETEQTGAGNVMGMLESSQEITQGRKADGCCMENVYGSYLHGFFDAPGIAMTIAEELAKKKGFSIEKQETENYQSYRESQYDILADTVRQHMDIPQIYRILEAGL